MSDNEAPLGPFGCLPALAELDFQCNALDEVTLGNGFQNLEVLNLSFNCLGSKDVEELSNLLRIRELYLGNNRIRSLPPIMDRFSRLETLSLESNNISGQEVFSFLTIMPRLRNLNLSHNKITGFPESALVLEDKRGLGFYNLIYLNLAHNTITDEAEVVHTSELRNLQLRFDSNDSTFLTGVGIEDVLAGVGPSAEIPAVPACMISRSLAAESRALME
ncbi:hypothetical protein BBJ29_000228 [Phytophthora kernoviae]|uniref:Protein phosphatase 1 regulatory subunit 7 n=1 Tax=Phytophthora kernoviae TaxID=325452 RepID=A0A3F2S4I4_9STRA|nr:hypothetical protein BBP00_00000414 [Phytophthora kernoviae]RLN70706.1 hypothetical protein BBJ29_000228 [Phytophthora kernoviae]